MCCELGVKMENRKLSLEKIFIIFLVVHVIVWSTLPFIRDLLPTDAMESIYWGGLFDFGTHKHPPLVGWMAYGFYNLLGKTDFSIYLLGQLCVLVGFAYLYKLGKIFLNKEQSILSVMVLEGCHVYSYMTVFDGFSPNFILFWLFPAIAYHFYRSIQEDKLFDWIMLGVSVGLGFLAKYQTVMLLLPMIIYSIVIPKGRSVYKKFGFYLSVFIAFLVFLPHLLWLIKYDFFSFLYFKECEERYAQTYHGFLKYLEAPFMFLLAQTMAIIGTVVIFLATHLRFNTPLTLNKNALKDDSLFLILLGICPVIFQALPGLITGTQVHGTWGYPMIYMIGILLFYFFPINVDDKVSSYVIKWVYATMIIILTVMLILFSVEKNFRSRYPYQKVSQDMKKIFYQETGKNLKYVGGYIEYALPISIYDETHPQMILDTYGHENPWVSEDEIKENGAIIMTRHKGNLDETAKKLVPYLDKIKKIEPIDYNFKIYNKFGQERNYTMYYMIISPIRN